MIWPGINSRLIAVALATRQTIDFRLKKLDMMTHGHSRPDFYICKKNA
ncbi:hypothetical protein [Rhizobium sp. BE258]|nr:hypothetical protein [Rhizobium sp. BE258]MDR7145346.1 hypothetical protein [Rhizobium sp. BE258]